MMRYRLLAAARREYLEVVRWYRDEVGDNDLAHDFIVELRQRLDRVSALPHAGALVTGFTSHSFDLRRVRRVDSRFTSSSWCATRIVVVVAISHERRRPGYWADRIKGI